ncbi:MAG: hypothetical protein R3B72_19675 [Polyangiaceae bacterium]
MSEPMRFDELGQVLRSSQDAELQGGDALAEARAKLLLPRPRRPLRRLAAAAFVLTLAAAVVVGVFRNHLGGTLRYTGGEGTDGGGWYEVSPDETLPLHFSDGSSVVLGASTRARVAKIGPAGAEVVVERGSLEVEVLTTAEGGWVFRVGPFDVDAPGARFEASWDPVDSRFHLTTEAGVVDVMGPGMAAAQRVGPGGTMDVDTAPLRSQPASPVLPLPPPAKSAALDPPGEDTPPVEPVLDGKKPVEQTPVERTQVAETQVGQDERPRSMPLPSSGRSWRELAAEGDHASAWKAVSHLTDALLETGSAGDLELLGTLAVYAGDASASRLVQLALRRRFPGTGQAARAAFALGRMAFANNPTSAAQWFDLYLAEAPNGALAREALGRTLELRRSPAIAARYLEHYPDGPHAQLARTILGKAP